MQPTRLLPALAAAFGLSLFGIASSGSAQEIDPAWDAGAEFFAGEVVITDRREPVVEQAGTATVITAADIAAHGDKTLDHVLTRVLGFGVYTHTKGQLRARLRGFDQSMIVVLIDGVPIDDIYSTDIDLAAFPVLGVAKIIVERGVSSALYGTDGTVGVINVITEKPRAAFGAVSTEYGLYNNSTISTSFGATMGCFSLLASGLMLHSEGFAPSKRLDAETRREWFDRIIRYDLFPVDGPFGEGAAMTFDDVEIPAKTQYIEDDGLWEHQKFTKYALMLKGVYSIRSDLEVGATLSLYRYDGKTNTYEPNAYSSYRGDAWKPNWPYFGDDPTEVKKFALRNRAFVWPLVYQVRLSPYARFHKGGFNAVLAPFYLEHKSVQEGYSSTDHAYAKSESTLFEGEGVFEPYSDIKKYRSFGFRFLPSYRFSKWNRLSASLYFRNDRYLGGEQAISEAESPSTYAAMGSGPYRVEDLAAWTFSLGFEDELTLPHRISLSAGVSYDSFDFYRFRTRSGLQYAERYIAADDAMLFGSRDSLNPVAGAVWEAIKDRLVLRGSGAIKTRFPSLGDYAKIETAELDVGLEPERAYSVNSGAELLFFERKLSARADYFEMMVDDKIIKLGKEEPPVNADRQTAQGIETLIIAETEPIGSGIVLAVSAGYTFTRARNADYSDDATVNKGRFIEYTPKHQLMADLRADAPTGTSFELWLTALVDQMVYAMDHRPTALVDPYSTDYFRAVKLHDPVYLNARISQRFLEDYEAALTVKNLLDDYDMDPFNPGQGRMFYLSLGARWGG